MPTVYMVRHGRAAAGFGSHRDPGLDDLGRSQAEAVADALASAIAEPIAMVSSPLARARETAAPLAKRWNAELAIEPRIAEIPSPIPDLQERSRWLRGIMAGRWSGLPDNLLRWRQDMIDCVLGFDADTIAFCHFIAINVVVGASMDDDRLIVFRPDNGSITRFDTDSGKLALLELGAEASTTVN